MKDHYKIILAVGAVVAGGYVVYKIMKPVSDTANSASKVVSSAGNVVSGAFDTVNGAISSVKQAVTPVTLTPQNQATYNTAQQVTELYKRTVFDAIIKGNPFQMGTDFITRVVTGGK